MFEIETQLTYLLLLLCCRRLIEMRHGWRLAVDDEEREEVVGGDTGKVMGADNSVGGEVAIEKKGGVGCLKITEDKSSKRRVQTPDAGLIITTTTAPRRKGRNPRLSLTPVASLQYQDARVKTRVSTSPQ